MNLEYERRLKFDRRLAGRRDWLSDEELQAELDALPDSAANVLPPDDEPTATRPAPATPAGGGSDSGTPSF